VSNSSKNVRTSSPSSPSSPNRASSRPITTSMAPLPAP
jgi:hypothetical protein